MKAIEFEGMRIGHLAVIRRARYAEGGKKRRCPMWECRCDCGKIIIVASNYLARRDGRLRKDGDAKKRSPQSCGCKNKISGQYAASYDPEDASWAELVGNYNRGAKARGLSWELDADAAKKMFASACHYCGAPPRLGINAYTKRSGEPYLNTSAERILGAEIKYNGIDRVRSDFGYTKDNCVPCCYICNQAKSDSTPEDFLRWIAAVKKKHNRADQ